MLRRRRRADSPGDARRRCGHFGRRPDGGSRLGRGRRGHAVHPVRARRGPARDPANRGSRPVRRRCSVRVPAGARHQPGRDREPADAARSGVVFGSAGRGHRLLLRPAHGFPVRGQPGGREAGRLPLRRHGRGHWMGCGLGRRCRARRRRVERRVPNPLLAAALPRPGRADLGHQLRAAPRAPGGTLGVGPHDPRRRRHRLAFRGTARAAKPRSTSTAGGLSLFAGPPAARPRRRGQPLLSPQRRSGIGGRRPQVRGDLRHHPGRDRQPGLRAGRGRPGPGQPDRLRDVLPGAQAVLRRGRGHLQLRHRPGGWGRSQRIAVLLAQDRALAPGMGGSAGRFCGCRRSDHDPGRLETLGEDGRGLVGRGAARDNLPRSAPMSHRGRATPSSNPSSRSPTRGS